MKTEIVLFFFTFLFLSVAVHFKEWLDHPIEHLMAISNGGALGIPGFIHPFVFTFIIYFFIRVPKIITLIFRKKRN